MCGLVFSPLAERLSDMLEAINHRGLPGRTGIEGPIGHVRLPIQGLGEDHDQPVRVDKWICAYVGEVFNYKSFSEMAECDTEVVIDQWIKFGPSGFDEFDGFWSFVAWDTVEKVLHVVTDHLVVRCIM